MSVIRYFLIFFVVSFLQQIWGDTLSISASPGTMTINSAVAGSQPTQVTNTSTTYSISTLLLTDYIIGSINSAMPSGTTLKVQLAVPSGATSAGSLSMSTTAQTLVSNISILNLSSNLPITYTFSVTTSAVQVTNGTRTLTLTLQ